MTWARRDGARPGEARPGFGFPSEMVDVMPVIRRPLSSDLFERMLRGEVPASIYVAQLRLEVREQVEALRRAR